MADLGDYLERVDAGDHVTVTTMYRNEDYDAVVDAWEHGYVDGATLAFDRDTAADWMGGTIRSKVANAYKQAMEGAAALLLEPVVDKGYTDADAAVNDFSARQLRNKVLRKDTKLTYADIGMGVGTGTTAAGIQAGSQQLTAAGFSIAAVSTVYGAKLQGKKERYAEEAADGLEQAYGGMELAIR